MKVKNKQLYSNDCGMNATLNLLDLYGFKIKKIDMEYDENGTSMLCMMDTLKKYFYHVEAVSFDIEEIRNVKHFTPYISLIQKDNVFHYIVIYKKSKKYIYILDSLNIKSYKITYEKFKEFDTKKSIVVDDVKQINLSTFKYKYLIPIPLLSILESIFLLSTTVLLQQIIDNGTTDAILYIIVQIFLLIITTYKVKSFLSLFKDLDQNMILKTTKNIYHLKDQYMNRYSMNEIYYRVNDAYQYKSMKMSFMFSTLHNVMLSICTVSLMMIYSYKLTLIVLFLCVFIVLISSIIFKKTCEIVEKKRENEYEFFNYYRDSFNCDKSLFKIKKEETSKIAIDKLKIYQKTDYQYERLMMIKNMILVYFQSILISGIILLYFTNFYEALSVGSLIAMVNLVTLLLQPILDICSDLTIYSNIQFIKKRLQDINENVE